ncbi:MAG: hypothetical protein J5823_00275 [Paludibacteraceae bacterium]|nr:hypothetical protein [Paludibacteraceae bacterium]
MTCLLLLACSFMSVQAEDGDTIPGGPNFPDDPGTLYVPSVVIVMGDTVDVNQLDTTENYIINVLEDEDSTVVYNYRDNVLTLTGATLEAGDSTVTAISYTGTDTLKIVLNDSSSILADTVIYSEADVVISGDGMLVAEGVVPIRGTKKSSITFDSVSMHVKSVPTPQALRRRIRTGKRLDETGGPALSGFGSADFNKTNVTPSDAEYGPLPCSGDNCGGGEEEDEDNVLYVIGEDGEVEVLDEFDLTAESGEEDAVETVKTRHGLDLTKPMFNILGLPVDGTYKGIVIQDGQTFLLL